MTIEQQQQFIESYNNAKENRRNKLKQADISRKNISTELTTSLDINISKGKSDLITVLELSQIMGNATHRLDPKCYDKKFQVMRNELNRTHYPTYKLLLDNPVYCGKIAYGRRTREKVKGTKADYKVVNKQDFCLVDGLHEGIVDEELWAKAHDKRETTGVKSVSKYGKDRAHLLTGIIKCPKCGSGMYANRVCWTKKDGTYKEVMYYACSRNKQERGRSCDYSANLKKTDIEPLVIEFIKELVQDEHFAAEIKKKIGLQVDTSKIDTEIHNYETKLKEVEINKARLEREIDSLPIDVAHRERKIPDMTLRLDGLYDTIAEIEANIEDARTRRKSVEAEFITMENIYKILEHFNELYDIISDEEKKELIATLVKEIQIYPEGESEMPLKSMKFNFLVCKDGKEVREIFLNNNTNVETLVCFSAKQAK